MIWRRLSPESAKIGYRRSFFSSSRMSEPLEIRLADHQRPVGEHCVEMVQIDVLTVLAPQGGYRLVHLALVVEQRGDVGSCRRAECLSHFPDQSHPMLADAHDVPWPAALDLDRPVVIAGRFQRR